MADEAERRDKEIADLQAKLNETKGELAQLKQERDAAIEKLDQTRLTREIYFGLRKEVEEIKAGTGYLMWRDIKPLYDKLNELENRIKSDEGAVK